VLSAFSDGWDKGYGLPAEALFITVSTFGDPAMKFSRGKSRPINKGKAVV
jgi:hypothetical protein